MPRLVAALALLLTPAALLAWPPRLDSRGDPLPLGTAARLGTVRWRHEAQVVGVAVSPDGKTIYTSAHDQTVRAWDAATGKETARVPDMQGSLGLRLSQDGNVLASCSAAAVRLHDFRTGKSRFCTPGKVAVAGYALSPDGRRVATGDHAAWANQETFVRVWDCDTGKELFKCPGHTGNVHGLAFTPDGKTLVTGGNDCTVRFWDLDSGKQVRVLDRDSGHKTAVYNVAVTEDGKMVVTSAETVRLWDAKTGKAKVACATELPDDHLYGLAVSPDGTRIAAVGMCRRLVVWDTKTGKQLWKRGDTAFVLGNGITFSPDGKTLYVGDGTQRVLRLDTDTGKPVGEDPYPPVAASLLAFAPDGKTLAVGGGPGVHLWDVPSGKCCATLPFGGGVTRIVYAPDGKTLAVAGPQFMNDVVVLFDPKSSKVLHRLSVWGTPQMGSGVSSLAFSEDGKTLVAGGRASGAWDTETGRRLDNPRERRHWGGPTGIVSSPDGRLQARFETRGWEKMLQQSSTGSGIHPGTKFPITQTTILTDAATGLELARFADEAGHIDQGELGGRIKGILPGGTFDLMSGPTAAFSADRRLMLYAAAETAWVRELAGGKRLWSKKLDGSAGLWFAADGRMLLHAMPGGAVVALDALDGKETGRRTTGGVPRVVALSPDRRWLATAQPDTTVLLWDVQDMFARREQPAPASGKELEELWDALGSEDVTVAWAAAGRLGTSPNAVGFLRDRLDARAAADEERAERLIGELNSQRFTARQKAEKELRGMGPLARPALAGALGNKPPLEVRRRAEAVLNDVPVPDRLVPAGEPLRLARAVQTLEWAGTKEARRLLETLAGGPKHALVPTHAREALERLRR